MYRYLSLGCLRFEVDKDISLLAVKLFGNSLYSVNLKEISLLQTRNVFPELSKYKLVPYCVFAIFFYYVEHASEASVREL